MTWGYDAYFSNIEKDNDFIGYQTFLFKTGGLASLPL